MGQIIINVAVPYPIFNSETDSALQCLDDFRKQVGYVFGALRKAGAE